MSLMRETIFLAFYKCSPELVLLYNIFKRNFGHVSGMILK